MLSRFEVSRLLTPREAEKQKIVKQTIIEVELSPCWTLLQGLIVFTKENIKDQEQGTDLNWIARGDISRLVSNSKLVRRNITPVYCVNKTNSMTRFSKKRSWSIDFCNFVVPYFSLLTTIVL